MWRSIQKAHKPKQNCASRQASRLQDGLTGSVDAQIISIWIYRRLKKSHRFYAMTKQSQQNNISEELALFLNEMGLVEEREEHIATREEYVVWLPTYEGEEPPF
jgi:hypothetical protein